MPSANTVAQKPAGSVNPLSSFGHAWFSAAAGLDRLFAGASELTMHTATSTTRANNKVLNGLDNGMEPSRESATEKSRSIVNAENIPIPWLLQPAQHFWG